MKRCQVWKRYLVERKEERIPRVEQLRSKDSGPGYFEVVESFE
jgi:hypothetical protein